ncbi:type IV pilus modification PilV family protein [Piscinibacter terrae]|uniref:Type II secretion system protein n=1 Tax=Piscinibacter terrae TaxID=2496871 RepID=A0A3N7K308_9BURK|nr:prepilin-type N-terminal cleavage/methylation domain-containing protein [Albitalea terrae]RQP25315.1 type II secretion system protein [Albitalea terrae]
MCAKHRSHRRQRGLSLIELVMFVAIMGMSIAGILVVYNTAIKNSADPMVRKQAVAIAESLLNEVLMQPFTWCDPQDAANDPNNLPTSGASCTGGVGNSQDKNGGTLGPQPSTESRFSSTDPFDNVADYNGYSMSSGIYSMDNGSTPVTGLSSYSATVTVSRAGTVFGLAAGAVLRVDVLVTGKGESITLTGYRFRHSPNATG